MRGDCDESLGAVNYLAFELCIAKKQDVELVEVSNNVRVQL